MTINLNKKLLSNSRLFLYIGFGLLVLSLVFLPIKTEVNVQTADFPDYETFNIGFLFAPVIGVWGLMSIAMGILASSWSRTKTVLSITPVFVLIYTGLAFTIWMVLAYGSVIFWWGYFSLFLVPSIVANIVTILYMSRKNQLLNALNNKKTMIVFSCFIVLVPLIFSIVFWLALL